jgi:hypothetical protein
MNPVVVSSTVQEFAGVRFHRDRNGTFVSDEGKSRVPGKGERVRRTLPRVVWSSEYGNIPHGWQVHHKDRDRSHNDIENLLAMAPLDHRAEHAEMYRELGQRVGKLPRTGRQRGAKL